MQIAFEAPTATDWTQRYSTSLWITVIILGLFAVATLVVAIRQRR